MNSQKKKRKVLLWAINIGLISIALLITAFAEDLSNIGARFKGYTSYVYPDMGKEHILGPEKTIYYAIHYDGNGQVQYGEIVRQADNFVLQKVYPDGRYEEFTPPPLTEKQKQDFINKYNPAKVQQQAIEREKELAKQVDKRYSNLVQKGLLKITKGNSYTIYTYTKPSKEVVEHFSYFFEGITQSNTKANPYKVNVNNITNKINAILKNSTLPVPLRVSIVPYSCAVFPQGDIQYVVTDSNKKSNKYELHIILFNNNNISMENQFYVQFKKYLDEVTKK